VATISIDHIVPRSKGGRTTWENVVAACQSCNRRKGDSTLEEAGIVLIRQPRQPSWRELLGEVDFPVEPEWLRYLDYVS
jgi:5-methylcytosine-specific restriction endonuclease McrA